MRCSSLACGCLLDHQREWRPSHSAVTAGKGYKGLGRVEAHGGAMKTVERLCDEAWSRVDPSA